ncbi:hypothetical protein INT48_001029 [Thamnidium elegans]|uniref:Uncharacterized protein n=1 Tax=Thamnidium elegans TaxID=101142 RepID=A0A8H7SWP6_9FUNG|nr:hypothetical protein INT48_001029 [Thamnidium elegans]
MEKVYDLHQHTHCVFMHIGETDVTVYIFSTSNRHFDFPYFDEVRFRSAISYNNKRTYVKDFGPNCEEEDEDNIVITNFRDRLYGLFKKGKATWEEEDRFLMKAVSDYLPAVIGETMEEMKLEIKDFDLFHYAFIVPSEWEEEIREDIIRPIFVQSGLISNEDHQDRLLFLTDIESIFYTHSFKKGENTILCRVSPEEGKTIIKFDLIQTRDTLYSFPNAKLSPMITKSVFVSTKDIEGRIKDFLRENLFPVAITGDGDTRKSLKRFLNSELVPSNQDQIIDAIIKRISSWSFCSSDKESEEEDTEMESWITFKNRWTLSESQKEFINLLCPFVVHAEIRENEINLRSLLEGAGIGIFEAIQNSDIYCKPRIMSSEDLTTSSSVFLNSKPDAIINLDISLESTLFTCSLLNEDGSIQQIFDHDYFIANKYLPPLGHFYKFLNTTTLNVKEQFIPFAERYLLGGLVDLTVDDGVSIKKSLLFEMKAILSEGLSAGEVLVSTDRQEYIKAFILMYLVYIKEDILYKLSDHMDMKIGYAVSIQAMLLNNTMGTKDNLRDAIFESGLLPKDDDSIKLRITTQGERSLPAIQKSLKLELSLKSYFLLCQLHEDYVQLSLHQVVTAPSSEQESIIVQDEIIVIQNIYDSFSSNIWDTLMQDSSLIELCEMHNTSNLFSSKTKTDFFVNLKDHIADNVLQNNFGTQSTVDTNAVKLNNSCNCNVRLTIADFIDISFTPVLQDIARTLSTSLLNKKLFGNYIGINYLFSFIHFNNNPQLQYTLARILEEEADDFSLKFGIVTSCLVVPELFSQLLRPVIAQQPFCYKDFKIGALQQVCSENYVIGITQNEYQGECPLYKAEITDTESIECDDNIVFPFLNKGDPINNVQSDRTFYLRNREDWTFSTFSIEVFRFKTMNFLPNNVTLSCDDNIFQRVDITSIEFGSILEDEDVDVPGMVSLNYVSYTASLQFFVKLVGADSGDKDLTGVIEIGEPLTLTRF